MAAPPITHVPVVAGPAYAEQVGRLPSKFPVTLRAEPDNRFNLEAVAVFGGGEKIGYLPPEISRHYFEPLKETGGAEASGRHAPVSAQQNTGVDVLLDLTGVPCLP